MGGITHLPWVLSRRDETNVAQLRKALRRQRMANLRQSMHGGPTFSGASSPEEKFII